MRLNSQYIHTQLLVQNMLKRNPADTTVKNVSSDITALAKKASGQAGRPSKESLSKLNYSKDSIVNHAEAFRRAYEAANDQTVAETKINAQNPYESESDIRKKILDEKYSKINALNKTKPDPLGYIKDKYKNSNSPYFRNDLSAAERQAAYDNETEWLFKGKAQNYNMQDAAFRNVNFNGEVEAENEKIYQRSQVNKQLQALLDQYHIAIPADAALTFTISPIDYQVKVSGTDDEQLIHQLEHILQSGENGKQLFLHIMKSLSSDSAQYSKEAQQKYQTVREIYEVTGYHLKDLEVVDGRYVTPDGRDLLDVYKEELEKDPVQKKTAHFAIAHYGAELNRLAEAGYDSVPDFILSIDYSNGSLRDTGQKKSYGTGDTAWLRELKRRTGVNH
ncbi:MULTISPECIES: DUF4885 domain-containing protein [Bacillus]|uniref:DUF4885 domain-containing protein n=1 Tax=Bacillus TaxID=1386 RepID=UPI0022446137|nr:MULTISPECIES: DUF4885 domain-containing protein [Bacillus]MDN5387702.1 DUF4885 domain-containing protein [Bacillus sp. LB7]MEC1023044.1 DUF4885 domain-containing protein [Bacillus paralicheniformis]MEC1028107.1 DUF4885 domain-containing protein [Bacillus paralicheniformis]MEC1035602.1 DUF4885 domain-containing protein [Bacillus paralicheniformis]MEC1051532.1 DUF4885 domain-containing protein [Bacillus paralicheniformis]